MRSRLPRFETKRLILREVLPEDVVAYERHFIDRDVIFELSDGVPWPYPQGGVEEFLREHIWPHQGDDVWLWGIFRKTQPQELIGCVHLWRKGHPEHRGFWLGKQFWGQGYMSEAVVPVNDYAFDVLGFDKLLFANALGNVRSRRVKEKTGAQFVGTRPGGYRNPQYTQSEIWELTKQRWEAHRSEHNES